jgi:hypothetical protein
VLLELIDQHDLERRIYRCVNCQAEGQSAPSFANDGYFFDGSEKPGKWVRHVCTDRPPKPAAKAPAKRKAKRAKAAAS